MYACVNISMISVFDVLTVCEGASMLCAMNFVAISISIGSASLSWTRVCEDEESFFPSTDDEEYFFPSLNDEVEDFGKKYLKRSARDDFVEMSIFYLKLRKSILIECGKSWIECDSGFSGEFGAIARAIERDLEKVRCDIFFFILCLLKSGVPMKWGRFVFGSLFVFEASVVWCLEWYC